MAKKWLKATAASIIAAASFYTINSAGAATETLMEVGEVRSTSDQAVVPVTIRNITYLMSGHAEITLPENTVSVETAEFTPSKQFDNHLFRTISNVEDSKLVIDFYSESSDAQQIKSGQAVIGYITYNLSDSFTPGNAVTLDLSAVSVKGRYNADVTVKELDGEIRNKMPIGDVVGNSKVTATGAMRILQHINGNFITEKEAFLSADVDADGILTQQDAMQVLDFSTGKRLTFLALAAKELPNGVLKSEYYEKVEARHGRAPYVFKKRSGTIPYGLKLNEQTGEITGLPTKAGTNTFTVEVTDAVGDTAERSFTIQVVDSNITSVEKLYPINVKRGEKPALPAEVTVTYKDKSIGKEEVRWNEVDTTVLGEVTAKGLIGDSGFMVQATVHVVDENYLKNTSFGYFQMLNIYTVIVEVNPEVYSVTINGIPAHYEGAGQYSLASAAFTKGNPVIIQLYDKYGNLLETKSQKLVIQ